jgi:hypothetical protein
MLKILKLLKKIPPLNSLYGYILFLYDSLIVIEKGAWDSLACST